MYPQDTGRHKGKGSVGRCGSFDVGFLPVCSCSAERWKRVYRAFLEGNALPPVELYNLGGAYFVVDGNHRVSVTRYRGAAAVYALVTEDVSDELGSTPCVRSSTPATMDRGTAVRGACSPTIFRLGAASTTASGGSAWMGPGR